MLINDLKAGMVFKKKNEILKILNINHHKPGKGNTVMRLKIKNIYSGSIIDITMRPDEKVEVLYIDNKKVKFLYIDKIMAYFMDIVTYNTYEIPKIKIENELKYILENTEIKLQFCNNEIIGILLPNTVILKVIKTQPYIKSSTFSGLGKPAILETGLKINVPIFIEVGNLLEINTQDNSYKKRIL